MKRSGDSDGPLLVFGPRSVTYDFGPSHPLTPRRFGPGIELLRWVGAEPGLAPAPAPDDDLALCHAREYIATVKRFSRDPFGPPEAGIGRGGDNPAFPGMHEAGAMVAGGSLRAMEAILRGDVEHAFHPGGGLHHAMRDHASGFCIYDDPALAIALARRDGLRVLYLDFDVHHGDGVEALFADDPGVMTVSFHESGRYLFPGTGAASSIGVGVAAGTVVNVPFEPYAGESAWLPAVRSLVPVLAAAFAPDVVVSQHGADSHAWDPLAHLRMTTTAMGEAARITDAVAHRWASGRWLSTGGGGYDAYRVVPRSWSLVWLAGAHRPPPDTTPPEWRERWADEAARYGQAPLPSRFTDPPNAGEPLDAQQDAAEHASGRVAASVREAVVPAVLRWALDEGWWSADGAGATPGRSAPPPGGSATLVDLDRALLDRTSLAAQVVPPADPSAAHQLLAGAVGSGGARGVAAVVGDVIVGVGLAHGDRLIALGVAPEHRRAGLASAMLERLRPATATVTVAERDPIDPLPYAERLAIARRLLDRAGLAVRRAEGLLASVDREALTARRPA